MNPTTAMLVAAWLAIVVLYLGLAATLREVRALRAGLDRRPATRFGGAPDPIRLSAMPAVTPPAERVVLVADADCELCAACVDFLPTIAPALDSPPVVLAADLHAARLPPGLDGYSDPGDLGAFAHLSPPVLVLVGPTGMVRDVWLVVDPRQIAEVCVSWGLMVPTEWSSDGTALR